MANGSVVHFEMPADDVARAKKFYTKTFGWKMATILGMGYTMVQTSPSDKDGMAKEAGNINGGMTEREAPVKHTVVTISVDDIDKSLKSIVKNGGSMVQKKTAIGPMGFVAYFKDSEGNIVGLFQGPGA
jgi:predicted enzyme related to lactoylglutathione lyase